MRLGYVWCPVCERFHAVSVYETRMVSILRFGPHVIACADSNRIWLPKRVRLDPRLKPIADTVRKILKHDFIKTIRIDKLWENGWNAGDGHEAIRELGIRLVAALGEPWALESGL